VRPPFAAAVLLLAVIAAPAAVADKSDKPRIDLLEVRREDDRVVVSFHVPNALADETLERLHSGLPVEHRHRVELVARRSMPLWPAKVLGRVRVDTSAVFDRLTLRFELSRSVRAGPRDSKKWVVVDEQRHSTASVDEVREWMTHFDALPALDLPESARGSRLRVRVESTLDRRFVWYMFPSKLTLSAERKLAP
jgi:hypothetical protein